MAEKQDTVVLYGGKATPVTPARSDRENLWLAAVDLPSATGWELKPEGLCEGEICVPLGLGSSADLVHREDGKAMVNLTGFARYMEQPVVFDREHSVWVFGPEATEWRQRPLSTEAPDFTLPDLDGRMYSLSDFRGTKVALACWASW
jgi:hypothetical protein